MFLEHWKVFTEVLYYIFLMTGVVFAYFQLRANTKAQQDLHSPALYIYCPKDADPINGLVIKNVGNVIATNVTIEVSEIKTNSKNRKKETTSYPLIDINQEMSIIDSKLHNLPSIKIKIIYHSPFHYREIKITKHFNRVQL